LITAFVLSAKAHAWSAAVLVNELDAGGLLAS
jgi:hypothetical protein